MDGTHPQPGRWLDGTLPPNVRIGSNSVILGPNAFHRFRSRRDPALTIGENCHLDGVQFAIGEAGCLSVGDYCYLDSPVLLCEDSVELGSYVMIGWNTTVTDADFHPLDPALRVADALALSPMGLGRPRPELAKAPVVVEDGVWIGANAVILKGVRIGTGAFVEHGSVVTRDVPAGTRVRGNPSEIVGAVE